jgi:hypothetical protein
MVRRIATCMGIDPENKAYLESKEDISAAEFVNALIREYREKEGVRTAVGEIKRERPSPLSQDVVDKLEDPIAAKEEEMVKIHAWFRDNDHILYIAKTQRKFTKKDLCRIKDDLYFSKYNVDANLQQIRKVLKEEMEIFDVKAYEASRGILPKV